MYKADSSFESDIIRTNEILSQAGVRVKIGSKEILSEADTKSILGSDKSLATKNQFNQHIVAGASCSSPLLGEATRLIGHNRTPGRITVYYVPKNAIGSGGGESYQYGCGVQPSSFVEASRGSNILAHELVHILANKWSHDESPDFLMGDHSPPNGPNRLDELQIRLIRNSPYLDH